MNAINPESNRPVSDWSNVTETVRLMTLAIAQMRDGLKAGAASMEALSQSVTGVVEDIGAIESILQSMDASEEKDRAIRHGLAVGDKVRASVVELQFYDRLHQRLEHVIDSLLGLSILIEDPLLRNNPEEWRQLRETIHARYTMEAEKKLFDVVQQGEFRHDIVQPIQDIDGKEDDIELF